jgi:Uma2 family endonuclease
MAIPVISKISAEEYLERERAAQHKSEYWHGEVFAMSGAVAKHVLICTNLTASSVIRLRGSRCSIFGSDMKVGVTKKRGFSYPDLSIACGQPKFFDSVEDVLMNPIVIFEVLSDSTRDFDLGGKFREYKRLDSLQHYITIEQRFREVELSTRQPDGNWLTESLNTENAVLHLTALGIELPLAEIYDGIELAPRDIDD